MINNGTNMNYQFIVCPHNTFECYLYLFKASDELKAVVLGSNGPVRVDDDDFPDTKFNLTKLSTVSGNGESGYHRYFPLYDYPGIGSGARPPGIGFFRYESPNSQVHWIAIFNWHNDTNSSFIKSNLVRFGESAIITDGSVTVNVNNNDETFDQIIVGGDFNYDMYSNPITNFTSEIANHTHLHTFDHDKDSDFNDSMSLRDASYDNILTRFGNNALTVSSRTVRDLPDFYMGNKLVLTKTLLSNSNLVQQLNSQAGVRVRMVTKVKEHKKKVSKKTTHEYKGVLNKENLFRVQSSVLIGKVNRMVIPQKQKDILVQVTEGFMTKELAKNTRWAQRSQDMSNLLFNDTLYLTRFWLSDHLPVYIELTP